jgi:hypothetical protein
MKNVKTKPFGYTVYRLGQEAKVIFKETEDGWLERDHVEQISKNHQTT